MKLKDLKNKVEEKLEQIHYEAKDAAPWYKLYEKLGFPKNLSYPETTIYEQIEITAKQYPEYIAYEYFGKKATFRELMEKIERCAKSLQKIGVTENDTVTILMPNTPESVIMFYACNMIGAIANMVHPLSSEGEIEFCLNKAKSNYVLTLDGIYDKLYTIKDKVNLKKLILISVSESMPLVTTTLFWLTKGRKIKIENPLMDNVVWWKDFIYDGRDLEKIKKSKKDANDPAVILYSGGTTGIPKGIVHSSRNFNATAIGNAVVCPSAKPGNSLLCILPIFHGFGLGVCFHTAWVNGMKCIIVPKFTPGDFGKLIKTYRPSFIIGVPTLYEALLGTDIDSLDFVSTAICGGDTLVPNLHERINTFLKEKGSSAEIQIGWGMTECVAAPIATPYKGTIPGSIGIPHPDYYVKIVKPGTEENLYYEDDGEICVSGPTVMLGYLDELEETKNTLRKHKDGKVWLHTGDMGYMTKEGIVIFKSRIKRMIISSGYNVYPNHIENVLNSHPQVLTSIVVGVPHPYKGEVAKAFVVLKPEFKASDEIEKDIMEHCKKQLAKFALPTSIEFRETLPVTKMGKADYRNVK